MKKLQHGVTETPRHCERRTLIRLFANCARNAASGMVEIDHVHDHGLGGR
jgi:hypothetical protein